MDKPSHFGKNMFKSRTMNVKFRLATLVLLYLLSGPVYSQVCDCVTTGNCPVPINDNGTYNGTLDVTVNGANDLGVNPITSVCFTITHTWIGDLSVSLTSPSGVNYLLMADINNNYGGCGMQQDNVDVCIVTGDTSPLTNNTEYSCNSGSGVCLTGDWTVPCGGVTDPVNGALQAPNCDLNDFNVPGDPANGTWTLTVVDVCNMDTGTLDNFSLNFANGVETCIVCSSDGGTLDSLELTSCYGSPDLLLNIPPNYNTPPPDSTYGYGYVLSQNGVVLQVDTLADLTTQPPGIYQVQGLSYLLTDSADLISLIGLDTATVHQQLISTTAPFCGDLSTNWITVTILPELAPTILDTTVCEGSCIMVGGQQMCASGNVALTSVYGCDSLVQVNLTILPPDTVAVTETVCANGCVDIGGSQYCAPGEYFITLTNAMGCDSVIDLTFNEIIVNAAISPANPPALTCTNNTVVLDGSGSSGNTYDWSGPNGFASSQASVTASDPGTYILTVSDNTVTPACQDNISVVVADGFVSPDLVVNGAAPQVCESSSFDLSTLTVTDQNNTNPTLTFHSGTPATPANELASTVVSPAATTTYYILGTTGICSGETSVTLTVNSLPTADFIADAVICSNGQATVTYAGSAAAGAIYNWDFAGGTATPGTGAGPHQVSWPTGGSYDVVLTVEENGCTSTAFTQTVTVDNPIPAPQLSCASNTSSIEFTWGDVTGASGYNVNVLSSPAGANSGAGSTQNSYLFDGLSPGDSVSIQVEAIGTNTCGNSSAQLTCFAEDCPAVTIAIQPVQDICLEATTTAFDLIASATGGGGTGTFTWSGTGVNSSGTFDPQSAAIGANTITATYQENNCIYTETIVINVYQMPVAAMIVPVDICLDNSATITFDGTAAPGAVFTWDFDGGTVVSGSGKGPYEVSWATSGDYNITLGIETPDGCISTTATETITVASPLAAPVISCSGTTSSVVFSWSDVPGAVSYNVNFISNHVGSQLSNTSYEVTNLQPGETVDFEVTAIGAGPCGNSSVQSSCTAPDCPNVTLAIDSVGNICRDGATAPVILVGTVTGNTQNGTLTWSGTGVDANGVFDPAQASTGPNDVTLTYEESTCSYSETITINVFETPVADFTVDAMACAGDDVTVTFTGTTEPNQTYYWNFDGGDTPDGTGPGPHNVSWAVDGTYTITLFVENTDGCVSETVSRDVVVEPTVQAPQIDCSSTTNSIVFSWAAVPGVTDLTVNTSPFQNGVLQGNTYTLNGLPPSTTVDFELTLTGAGGCPPVVVSSTCATDDCPPITIAIDAPTAFCLGASTPTALNAVVTGSTGSGSGIWSGTGIDAASGLFDPVTAGVGAHLIKYDFTESGCMFEDSILVNVYQTPTADFTSESNICIDDAATVNFVGTAGSNAVFNWDFDGGAVFPGVGPGPHQVIWDTPGNKTITLTIDDSGCSSAQFSQQVQVDEDLSVATVSCSSTTSSIVFSWDAVPGATGYEVEELNQPSTAQTVTNTDYTINSLAAGQEVTIQVTAIGNTACPVIPAIGTCSTQPCWDIAVDLQPVDPICLEAGTTPVTLQATVSGAPAQGTATWSGDGIVDAAQGIFDPATAGEGIHLISHQYQIDNCIYTNEMEIKVGLPPVADAGLDASITCWDSEQSARLGGDNTSVGPNVVFEWTTDTGDLPDNTSILRPVVTAPGTYILTVSDLELGCSSTDEVVVTLAQDIPQLGLSFSSPDCSGQNTTVAVDTIDGGMAPYLFSLNGEPFVETDTFPFLSPGTYSLAVIDGAGCENETGFDIEAAGELSVLLTANLVGRNHILEGESIQLLAILSVPEDQIDSIVWTHPELLDCSDCLDPMATPLETTTFEVAVYRNGCFVTAELTINVEFKNDVYVPNAFSPNGDKVNDVFQVYPGPRVAKIKSFVVFDRWGEMVSKHQDYLPDDMGIGWDGTLDGKPLNPGVFVWYVEVELVDGSTKLLEGDVILMR